MKSQGNEYLACQASGTDCLNTDVKAYVGPFHIFAIVVFIIPVVILLFDEFNLTTKPARAANLNAPTEEVILRIFGDIENSNNNGVAAFDMLMLSALPRHEITTVTPWTDGETSFSGPLLRDLLNLVGAKGGIVVATALSGHSVEIPYSDALDYPVIVACYINGQTFGVRDRGPLWVIYPWSEQSGLRNSEFYSRSVWQLKELVVKSE